MRDFFNIQRIYFRRPIWTSENRRLWLILLLAFLLVIPLNIYFIHWSYKISREHIAQRIKTGYIAFLRQGRKATPTESPRQNYTAQITQLTQRTPAYGKPTGSSAIANLISQTENTPDINAETYRTDTLGMATITSAVEVVAGYTGIERYQSRQEKSLDLQNRERIFRTRYNRIQIPLPEVLHFASRNGMRDLQETTAILEINEEDIKYCFEKVARYDPTFSASVLISFTIHPDGYVIPASVKIIQSNVRDPQVLDCIRRQIQRWHNFTQIAFEDGNFTVTRKYIF